MLTEILAAFSQDDIVYLFQITERTGYTAREVESALTQLEYMGYIKRQTAEKDCLVACQRGKSVGNNCHGCHLGVKQVLWSLTDLPRS